MSLFYNLGTQILCPFSCEPWLIMTSIYLFTNLMHTLLAGSAKTLRSHSPLQTIEACPYNCLDILGPTKCHHAVVSIFEQIDV